MLSIKKSALLLGLFTTLFFSCKDNTQANANEEVTEDLTEEKQPFFKLSLAQWSLNNQIYDGELDPMDFAQKASSMGFEGIEYVNSFYTSHLEKGDDPEAAMQNLLDSLKAKSEQYDVQNLVIMIDGEGDLANSDEEGRNQAVENHKKWVDAAQFLGCHSIRVNLFGANDPEEWKTNSIDALTKLSEYAATKNINVLVENHGYLSSNAALLVEVMEEVNLPNCGTLPDFGNFCLKREGNSRWNAKCVEEYPRYQGVEELLPHAKAVSAKSYDFNEEGQETLIDYARMLKLVKEAGYSGFIGVEYEGSRLSEEEGILATKELLIAEGTELTQNNN